MFLCISTFSCNCIQLDSLQIYYTLRLFSMGHWPPPHREKKTFSEFRFKFKKFVFYRRTILSNIFDRHSGQKHWKRTPYLIHRSPWTCGSPKSFDRYEIARTWILDVRKSKTSSGLRKKLDTGGCIGTQYFILSRAIAILLHIYLFWKSK